MKDLSKEDQEELEKQLEESADPDELIKTINTATK